MKDERSTAAGQHLVRFDGRGSDGGRLRDGVYYYRIFTPDGLKSGRVVILP